MSVRTTKKLSVSLPGAMLNELDRTCRVEQRTRSELVREALRQYLGGGLPLVEPAADEIEAIERGRAAIAQGDYVSFDELTDELGITNSS